MFCTKCGFNNSESSSFCAKCGERLSNTHIAVAKVQNCTLSDYNKNNYINSKNKKLIIAIIISGVVLVIALAIILAVCLSNDSSSNSYYRPSSKSSSFDDDLIQILMQDWYEPEGSSNRFVGHLYLDFGYDQVVMKHYRYENGRMHTITSSTYYYLIISSNQLAFFTDEGDITYYNISFNNNYTIMYFQEADDGIGDKKQYVMYVDK